jgi:hypothetical protein
VVPNVQSHYYVNCLHFEENFSVEYYYNNKYKDMIVKYKFIFLTLSEFLQESSPSSAVKNSRKYNYINIFKIIMSKSTFITLTSS